jgi:hypothetical protein
MNTISTAGSEGALPDQAMDQAVRAYVASCLAGRVGDQHRAGRQETLAGSYGALRDLYRQREQSLAQSMADRQDWEHATAPARHLAVAADAEPRRRHSDQQIDPLRSAEPVPATDTGRDGKLPETTRRCTPA